jgi:hypothetical protein
VPSLLPHMAPEPPDGYVAFVARHLTPLRDAAARALGDEHDGDRIYPEVLSDVAGRWRWLELRRRLPGQAAAADEYLDRALSRRVRRLESERIWSQDDPWLGEIQVWHPDDYQYRPAWSSSAVRVAPYLRPSVRVEVGPIAEAAIAWWHAYENRRRQRLVAVLVAVLLLVALLMRVQTGAE